MLLYKPWKGIYTFNKFLAKCGERECLFIKCFCCTVLNWCKSSLKFILWTCSRNGKSCAPWVSLKWKNGKEKKNSIKSIMHHKSYNPKRKENLYTDQVACPGRAYSGFCSMKQQEVFPSPLYGMLAHCRLLPPLQSAFCQVLLTVHQEPFRFLGGQQHSEGCVLPKSTTQSCTLPVL